MSYPHLRKSLFKIHRLVLLRNIYAKTKSFFLKLITRFYLYPVSKLRHQKILKRITYGEGPVSALFIVRHASQWKYQGLLEHMINSQRYEPKILIAPDLKKQDWKYDQKVAIKKFSSQSRIDLIFANDDSGNFSLNRKDLSFDLVFFPKSIEGKDPLSILKFKNSLCCYIPYSTYGDNNPELQYNRTFHNLLWRHYVATEIHQKISREVSFNKASNVVVSGYPAFDIYLHSKNSSKPSGVTWPQTDKKKIIWAPHHSIEESEKNSNHSTFLRFFNFFQNLVHEFKKDVFFVFKPHPNLRRKLHLTDGWGPKKTDEYFEIWDQQENSMLVEGSYEKLFLDSDAMIHDSVSFMAESVCLKKPVCYLVKNEKNHAKFLNDFGQMLLGVHKKAYSKDDIVSFINNVITDGTINHSNESYSKVLNILNPHPDSPSSKKIFDDLNTTLNQESI
jgi:hypothetical protein